jgi:hypothetical protein
VSDIDIIREQIDKALAPGEPIIPSQAAEQIVDYLEAKYPSVLLAFARRFAVETIRRHLIDLLRKQRTAVTFHRPAPTETERVGVFMLRFQVDEENRQKRLGDMDGTDCEFAAAQYEMRSASNAIQAAVLRAIQKRIGKKKVSDAITEEQCRDLMTSITQSDRRSP